MIETVFEIIYLLGLIIATIIRTGYGMQFRPNEIIQKQTEHPMVYVGMALWGIALLLPIFYMFSPWLDFASYQRSSYFGLLGVVIFIFGLWLLWRSHADLKKNFSPSLFIRGQHTLVTYGVYKRIRHPMYLSFWCWAIGQALLITNWLAGLLGIIAFYLLYLFRVNREEQQLFEYFGVAYANYQKITGRLFPKSVKSSKS